MTQDEEHLNLLSIFHYVVGGMTGLFACFPLIHVAVGIAMVTGGLNGNNPPPLVGWLFIIFPSVIILTGWALAAAMIIVGRKLKARRSRTFCLVVAGFECIVIPFGTVLGIFTLIVLTKESVAELFE